MARDWAEQQTRKALQQYRRGDHISASCVEIYDAVTEAIRAAYKRGEAEALKVNAKFVGPRPTIEPGGREV